jgi:4-hydroxy-4-methyl-2-oxoglutarate aldolase
MDLSHVTKAREPDAAPASYPVATAELCARYEAVFTAAVNDVLREMNLLHQTLPTGILPLRDAMRVAGPAFTIKGAKSLEIKNEMAERAAMLEALYPHCVVAWDTSGDDESAQWGEVMTMAAVKRGCRGAVVDGGVRDTDRVLEQQFPVFCRYRSSNGMLGRFRISGWQVPVRIGQVQIMPGDIIFGDIDGVIVVPRALALAVLERAEAIRDSESTIKQWVREGLPATEIVRRGGYF